VIKSRHYPGFDSTAVMPVLFALVQLKVSCEVFAPPVFTGVFGPAVGVVLGPGSFEAASAVSIKKVETDPPEESLN
jgi:hypothetical protein